MEDESKLPMVFRRNMPEEYEKIKKGHYKRTDYDYPLHIYLKEPDLTVIEDGSELVDFLKGKVIFITGATGFLGKLLVEKLLRSCKDIGHIYIMVRSKAGRTIETRVNEYLDGMAFIKLSRIYPDFRRKVTGINGDMEMEGLGLSEESKDIIKDKVNIIYHVAATVRFDEKLKKAVTINVLGTQELLRLAKQCKKLDVFAHMSTAFSNCNQSNIKEQFYPPYMDPYQLMTLIKGLPEDVIDNITPELLGNIPNTYVFTKQIAEDVVRRESVGLPVCMQRPSIVLATYKEPIRCWLDTMFGPSGLLIAASMGLVHIIHADPNKKTDCIPADYVINGLIAASCKTAKERQLDKVQVFNSTSSNENKIFWRNMGMVEEQGMKIGTGKMLWTPFYQFTPRYYCYTFLAFFLHTVPAYVVDFVAVRTGQKPQLVMAFKKISKFFNLLQFFTLNEWMIESSNTAKLWDDLNDVDRKNFPFDMKHLDWRNYLDCYMIAMRELLILDNLDVKSLEDGRRHLKKLLWIHYITVATIFILSVYFFINTIFFFIPVTLALIILFYLRYDCNK